MRRDPRSTASLWSLALATATLVLVPGALAEQDFDSGDLAGGASWSFTFTQAYPDGYTYHCHPHPWMQGMVHVLEDTDGETRTWDVSILEEGDPEDWGYSVEHLAIEVGDTVTWTNTGDLTHTVTRMDDGTAHDHGSHDHGDPAGDVPSGNDAPGPAAPLLLAGLLGAAALATRRR